MHKGFTDGAKPIGAVPGPAQAPRGGGLAKGCGGTFRGFAAAAGSSIGALARGSDGSLFGVPRLSRDRVRRSRPPCQGARLTPARRR